MVLVGVHCGPSHASSDARGYDIVRTDAAGPMMALFRNTFRAATSLTPLEVLLALLVIAAGCILYLLAQEWLGLP